MKTEVGVVIGGDGYRAMIEMSPAKRMASPDEIAVAANVLWDRMQLS